MSKALLYVKAPHPLLDYLKKQFDIETDRKLAYYLGISYTVMSKIRHMDDYPVTDSIILKIHETFELPVKKIRKLINEKVGASRSQSIR
jgi:hypothetical protein